MPPDRPDGKRDGCRSAHGGKQKAAKQRREHVCTDRPDIGQKVDVTLRLSALHNPAAHPDGIQRKQVDGAQR